MPRTLVQELDALHADYVAAVNLAVEQDDTDRADELAAAYDDDATRMVAEREGKTHLLSLRRPVAEPVGTRRWARRRVTGKAA